MPSEDDYLDRTFRELGDLVAARTAAPGGGSVAALAVTLAAALVAMAARFSDAHWEGASAAVERAETLRAEVGPLAAQDAAAYAAVLKARRAPAASEEERRKLVAEASSRAADVPLRIGRLAAEVAELGAAVARLGNPSLEGDAVAGALLAQSAAQIASRLVELNLEDADVCDRRIERARAFAAAAEESARLATRRR